MLGVRVSTWKRKYQIGMPNYKGLKPASARASLWGRKTSHKTGSKCELLLREALKANGITFQVDVESLHGRPDIVIADHKIAIFCDGDFWHGRDLKARLQSLSRGHNSAYWTLKIAANVARDRRLSRL